MTEQHIILPVGISGSGKTTWAKAMSDFYSIISLDDLREELTGDMNDKSQDVAVYEQAVQRMVVMLFLGKNVIIDSTNLTKEKRVPFIQAALSSGVTIYYKLMPLDPTLAKSRIQQDIEDGVKRANVTPETIDRHVASYWQAIEDLKKENILQFN